MEPPVAALAEDAEAEVEAVNPGVPAPSGGGGGDGEGPVGGNTSAGDGGTGAQLTNAARALIIGALSASSRSALEGIELDVAQTGSPLRLSGASTWADRDESLARSDDLLREMEVIDDVREMESAAQPERGAGLPPFAFERIALWSRIAEQERPPADTTFAFLRLLSVDSNPIVSAAASSALAHRSTAQSGEQSDPGSLKALHRRRLEAFLTDNNDVARSIAESSLGEVRVRPRVIPRRLRRERHPQGLSLIVHGTHAFDAAWWVPGSDFHKHISSTIAPDLYSLPDAFYWSGRLRQADRKVGAEKLAGWVEAKGSPRMHTAIAHSYGASVLLGSAPGLVDTRG